MKRALFTAAAAALCSSLALATDYDEGVSGDLSDDRLAPDSIQLELGSNLITSTQQGDAFGRDIDYFTVVVPTGMELAELRLPSYVPVVPFDLAFLGLQAGSTFTVDAESAEASDLLGGIVFGDFSVGTDMLPSIGTLGGSIGFTPPLPAGSYTIWMNQTSDPSTSTLNFVLTGDPVGTSYCSSTINTSGFAASLGAVGIDSVGANEFTLVCDGLPVGTPGLFFVGPNQIVIPFGEGIRCVGGSITRLPPVNFGSAGGVVTRTLDLSSLGGAGIAPGNTRNFQYWFRDVMGGPEGFNLSDGLEVSFQ